MSKKRLLGLRISLVTSTVLFGIASTAVTVAKENRDAISKQFGQPTFKIEYGEGKPEDLYKSQYKSIKDLSAAGHKLVKDIEGEGATLLVNNNNALPLSKGSKITLFGVQSVVPSYGGRGSAHAANPQHQVDLKEALGNAGFSVNDTMYKFIKEKTNTGRKPDPNFPYMVANGWNGGTPIDMPFSDFESNPELVNSLASHNDVAIMTLSRCGAENSDVVLNDTVDGLKLTKEEASTLAGLGKLKREGKVKKVVVLLNTSNQIQTSEIMKEEYGIDAVLWMGQVGINGTEAVAEILNGTINPSGSLPDTYWYNHKDNPVVNGNYGAFQYPNRKDFPELPQASVNNGKVNDKWAAYVTYQEGVYLGYRYSETRYTDTVMKREGHGDFNWKNTISYPFGFGLSYTDFKFSNFNATETKEGFKLSVDVKNVGKVAGKESVQFYIQKPYTQFDIERGIEKPAVELIDFGKTDIIEPGKTQTVTLDVSKEVLKVYDRKVAKTYIVTEGDYLFTAAEDAHQAANNFLAKAGKTTADGMTENGDATLVKSSHQAKDEANYSRSRGTGAKITNLFDQADINSWKGNTLDYYTRSNWSKSLTKDLKLTQEMVNEIVKQENSDSLKPDDGKYPTYGADNGLQLINLFKDEDGKLISYDDPIWDLFLDQLTWKETTELVGQGFRCSAALDRLGKPQTMDHNGPTGLTQPYSEGNGFANKLNDPDKDLTPVNYTTVPVLAATFNKDLAKRFGEMIGEDALWAGYNGFYGIGINTHRSPYEGRAYEYFSEDPILAGTMAAIESKEIQARGTNAFIKHFALNDQETQRYGIQVWLNEQAFREIYLRPFELAVIDGGAANAMVSLTRIGLTHATACKPLLTDFLRNEVGMIGYAVSDMWRLQYNEKQLPFFIMNGLDIPDGALDQVKTDWTKYETGYSELAWRMREAAKRTMYATLHSNAMNGFSNDTKIIRITPPWEVAANSVLGVISAIWAGCLAWGVAEIVIYNKNKKAPK